jgi:hypothetical protein
MSEEGRIQGLLQQSRNRNVKRHLQPYSSYWNEMEDLHDIFFSWDTWKFSPELFRDEAFIRRKERLLRLILDKRKSASVYSPISFPTATWYVEMYAEGDIWCWIPQFSIVTTRFLKHR